MKRFILLAIATVFFFCQFQTNPVNALELDEATRTVALDETGKTTIVTSKQITNGQRLFVQECTQCHLQGKTKTNNNVSLGLDDLAGAEPPRNNVLALVDYLKHPTSYDGEDNYEELHVNVTRPDLFPELRNFTEDDLYDVAGYVLVAPKLDAYWGGSIYF
ncbi:cytochrome c-550 [Rippkaea orientalis PCC 8801]|uniref:Photosystem II extrinsic protein V n=1 Tax=Rippkaea orientalis (strain PCC 8801 / RF-1) TaxID=41431 RepID=CY550_RIPO1|nr:photosystem II cytochrome c-550 [Rippkaea orientalis]B7JV99.1 RecName: Full=Photosystem II extrinsic protein V; Short=PsbV; AltName: Full=Cytochrome c-550; AltName: Full=Cytochrome c550; AltName: Full=Low-potential cytochrome c; Flags: Precursor [Rippkaea orientalis PCC 8801]ACK68232.1 cytochrome c-550 [Rippkaea orientalis PCC 8801]